MSEPKVTKISVVQQFSEEILAEANPVAAAMEQIIGEYLNPPPAEELERRARARGEREIAVKLETDAKHAAVMATASGFQVAVLELHKPVVRYGHAVCEGCDMEGYEVESPSWPCRTYELARDWRPGAVPPLT